MPYLSKRFALKRFLGLSEEEMAQNQVMWSEEKGEARDDAVKGSDLRNVGVTAGGIGSDIAGQTEPAPQAPDVDLDADEGEGIEDTEGDEE